MKKCFTINQNRTEQDFIDFSQMIAYDVFQAIEIFYPYNVDEEKRNTYRKNIRKLKQKYPHLEVVMHLPHGPQNSLCDFENYKTNLQRMKDGIEFTKEFDTKKLTLHLGYVDKNTARSKYITHISVVLKELCDYAKKYDMNVMIENMPGSNELGYSPDEILDIIEATNKDNLKFILDTGHAHVSEYPIGSYISDLRDYLYHTHFSDNDSTRDAHQRIGSGTIDFVKTLQQLNKIKYEELYCLEILFDKAEQLLTYAKDLDDCDEQCNNY